MATQTLLIDTDPGVDDALALMMAHRHADVAGLTITAGNVGLDHTVRNALKLCEVGGWETPVYPGCPEPMLHPADDAAFVHGQDGFGDVGYLPPTTTARAEHAALAIIREGKARPGELTLVALGPLTNLALALMLDPDLPSRFKRLLVMGGAVTGRGNTHRVPAEFNIGFDPEAAAVVFSRWPEFDLVDWEATVRHAIPYPCMDRWLSVDKPLTGFYGAISGTARRFAEGHGRGGFLAADALAMAVVLRPELVQRAERHHVAVETVGEHCRGATVVDWEDRLGRPANANVVLEIDQGGFEDLLASTLESN
ncbi:MAG: nucleoside hydrolase [Lysobacteraceae bacterium]